MIKNKKFESFLEFTLNYDASEDYINRWQEIWTKLYDWQNNINYNTHLFHEWTSNCKIDSNKNLKILNKYEGGLGGNINEKNKQLRIERLCNDININNIKKLHKCLPIKICFFDSWNKNEVWTIDELTDLIRSFIISLNNKLNDKHEPGLNMCCQGSLVYNYDNSYCVDIIDPYENDNVDPYESTLSFSYENDSVNSYENDSVNSYENDSVDSYENDKVDSYENDKVDSYENDSVDSYENDSVDSYKI
jgi:hypothetical protein